MELLTSSFSSTSIQPISNGSKPLKSISKITFDPTNHLQNHLSIPKTAYKFTNFYQNPFCIPQTTQLFRNSCNTPQTIPFFLSNPLQNQISTSQTAQNSFHNYISIHKTASKVKFSPTQLPKPLQNDISIPKTAFFLESTPIHLSNTLQNRFLDHKTALFANINTTHIPNFAPNHILIQKTTSFVQNPITHLSNSLQNHLSILKTASFLSNSLRLHLSFVLMATVSFPFPSLAIETAIQTEQSSDKLNIEAILLAIDDFFNRNPFFVAGVTFIWLVVIPLTQEYFKKFKFVSAFIAFCKLKDNPNSQLLDIRKKKTMKYLGSPNLKILKKSAVHIEFSEGDEEGFVKEVLGKFSDPAETIVCVLDNFDGNSMKVAELLFKSGFKEAYAIKGGLRGKDGWQEIQENLLPPSVHVYSRKKDKKSLQLLELSRETLTKQDTDNGKPLASTNIHQDGSSKVENGYVKPAGIAPQANCSSKRPLSPYPNYPDMKPPSSPTPSKPC